MNPTVKDGTPALLKTAAALSLVALLGGCRSEESAGIKPVTRMEELSTPAPRTVQTAAGEAAAAAAARSQAIAQADAVAATTTNQPSETPTASATETTDASRIQGIPAPPPTTIHQGGNILAVAGIAFTIPPDWKQVAPSSALRAAQYAIPGPGGDAEVAVFYFGPGQGGNVDQNVQRWVGQFKSEDAANPQLGGEVGTLEADGLRLTLVRTEGTYNPGVMGGGADNTPKPGYALFGLVVEGGPEGNLFVKVTGPAATLGPQKESLENFARSARKSRFH